MKYWFDTEFMEDGRVIEPLSIGMVAEDGREFYAEFHYDPKRADIWVADNVLPHLKGGDWQRPVAVIRQALIDFIGTDSRPEFWAYYADYDWVLLCQIFGRMVDLPKGWPKYCMDIKQLANDLCDPKLPPDPPDEHHALADARWNRKAYEFLEKHRDLSL